MTNLFGSIVDMWPSGALDLAAAMLGAVIAAAFVAFVVVAAVGVLDVVVAVAIYFQCCFVVQHVHRN